MNTARTTTRLLQQCLSSDQYWQSTNSAVSPECRCSTHHMEAEVWTHCSEALSDLLYLALCRLTVAAYPLANNIRTVYHCLQVSTLGSSILSGRNACSGCWQHWPSLSSFSGTWRSDGAQNENDNVYGSLILAVFGSRVWNDLPPTSRASSTTLGQLQSRLKTTRFRVRLAYGTLLGAFVTV